MGEKSKILIIGGTGYIGKFIVEASAKSGNPTFALLRDATSNDPAKSQLIQGFQNSGVIILKGDLNEHESLVKAMKQVDVVISTVGEMQLADQVKIIGAIKEAGNIKRFLPSEFGNDVDRGGAGKIGMGSEGGYSESYRGGGHTFPPPPKDKLRRWKTQSKSSWYIFFSAVFNDERDIGTYTIKAVDDPITLNLNKTLYIKPPKNIYSFNELAALWEKKIGKTLEKIYVPEDQLLKQIAESAMPINIILAINHSVFVKSDQTYFEIKPSFGFEASQLYPDVKYTTVDEYIDQFV